MSRTLTQTNKLVRFYTRITGRGGVNTLRKHAIDLTFFAEASELVAAALAQTRSLFVQVQARAGAAGCVIPAVSNAPVRFVKSVLIEKCFLILHVHRIIG